MQKRIWPELRVKRGGFGAKRRTWADEETYVGGRLQNSFSALLDCEEDSTNLPSSWLWSWVDILEKKVLGLCITPTLTVLNVLDCHFKYPLWSGIYPLGFLFIMGQAKFPEADCDPQPDNPSSSIRKNAIIQMYYFPTKFNFPCGRRFQTKRSISTALQ